jgi:hypothetical protein
MPIHQLDRSVVLANIAPASRARRSNAPSTHNATMRRLLPACLIALAPLGHAATASCPTIDAFGDFAALATATDSAPDADRLARFNRDFIGRYAALYVHDAIGLAPGPALDAAALPALKLAAQTQASAIDASLRHVIADVTARLANAFPDFRCDFPIWIAPTFGQLDGAGRIVAGQPSLILGPDVISRFETVDQLPVFVSHELFHRYHFQAAGFSDDLAERDLIWRALWAEGLATYVSAQLNPARPLADALLLPRDLQRKADPLVPALAAEIAHSLDRVDPAVFSLFFDYGDTQAAQLGRPWRSGYYLGYLVAQRLGTHRTLSELAHLQGSALRREIGDALAAIAAEPR